MPTLQFFSPEADDAKWLIWGKILHRKGTRGTKYPEPNVRVQITENAIRVSREAQAFYYSSYLGAPYTERYVNISRPVEPFVDVVDVVEVFTATERLYRRTATLTGGTQIVGTLHFTNVSQHEEVHVFDNWFCVGEDTDSTLYDGPEPDYSGVEVARWNVYTGERRPFQGGEWVGVFTPTAPTYNSLVAQQGVYAGGELLVAFESSFGWIGEPGGAGVGTIHNYPQVIGWSGSGQIQLFDSLDGGATWEGVDILAFSVPADAMLFPQENTGPTPPPLLPDGVSSPTWSEWSAAWYAGYAEAVVRQRDYVKGVSDSALSSFMADPTELMATAAVPMDSGHPRVPRAAAYNVASLVEFLVLFDLDPLYYLSIVSEYGAFSPFYEEYVEPAYMRPVFRGGEQISIFLLSVVHSDLGDLGMIPQEVSLTDASKLSLHVHTKYTYAYNAALAAWGDGTPKALDVTLPYQAGVNIVFRSSVVPWAEAHWPRSVGVQDPGTYDGQQALMTANPDGYPLFVPLLSV